MRLLLVILLAVNVVFNIVIWPRFIARVRQDPRSRDEHGNPTKFLTVHNILFGAVGVVTIASLIGVVLAVFVD